MIRISLIFILCLSTLNAGTLIKSFDPKQFNPEYTKRLLKISKQTSQQQHKIAHALKRFDVKEWRNIWEPLPNIALSYRLSGDKAFFENARHKLMVLCSYQTWGHPDSKWQNIGVSASLPLLNAIISFDLIEADLPSNERIKVLKTLIKLGEQYLQAKEQKLMPSWFTQVNHPHYSMHLLSMYLIGRVLENEKADLAQALIFYAYFEFNRIADLYAESADGATPFGPSQSLLYDYGYLLYVHFQKPRNKQTIINKHYTRKKLDWYKACLKPGYQNYILLGDSLDRSMLAYEPILYLLASWYKDSSAQFMASRSLQSKFLANKNKIHNNWMYLNILLCDQSLKAKENDNFTDARFDDSGIYIASHDRGEKGNHLSFVCGDPAGKTLYQRWLKDSKDIAFKLQHPDQGSFTWNVKGKPVITDTGYHQMKLTHHHNTLKVDSYGQIYENPLYYLGGRLKQNTRHGVMKAVHRKANSMIYRAELKDTYPLVAGIQSFDRTLIWLGPEVLVIFDQIDCIQPSNLSLYFRSRVYPLTQKSDGFYQKITGMQLHSDSLPKAKWKVSSDYHTHLKKPNHYAVASVNAKSWVQACVIGNPSLGQDVTLTQKGDNYHIMFSAYKYELKISKSMHGKWFTCYIHQKPFIEITDSY